MLAWIRSLFALPQVVMPRDDGYQCTCHKTMQNEFWFMPSNMCLRQDGKCDFHPSNLEERRYERPF